MSFQQVFDKIFDEINTRRKENIERHARGDLASESTSLGGSGEQDVEFDLDANGNAAATINKYGASVTVHLTASIKDPDDQYDVTVKSSDGGGGSWQAVGVNQNVSCDLQTSFWHSTDFSVTIHAHSTRSRKGHAHVSWSY